LQSSKDFLKEEFASETKLKDLLAKLKGFAEGRICKKNLKGLLQEEFASQNLKGLLQEESGRKTSKYLLEKLKGFSAGRICQTLSFAVQGFFCCLQKQFRLCQ
jgi:sulfur carrier protein ThiS